KINILDEIDSIKNEIKKLKHEVKIFALISHVGYEKDKEIAKKVKDLHFIVGGHTNTFLYNGKSPGDDIPAGPYPTVVTRKDDSIALVTQDYCFGKYLGFLMLQFDASGNLKNWSGNPILMDHNIKE
ncbi:5' nucleotidase, putative, partial [Ixodes scapularis]